jgi:sialate O-acetylesterase
MSTALRTSLPLVLSSLLAVLTGGEAAAQVKLASIFTDHMVMQRGASQSIWGTAKPGEQITVHISGQTRKTATDSNGRWKLALAPMRAGGPHTLTAAAGSSRVRLKDVLVGEVWLVSGQSNMAWPVGRAARTGEAIASARLPRLRLYQVPRYQQRKGARQGRWVVCSPKTVQPFSALGFFFGRRLIQELKVPVGLIDSSLGNTTIEAWIGRGALEVTPAARPILARWRGRTSGGTPAAQAKARLSPRRPAALYEAMIRPLAPFALRGVLWYQGESNVNRAEQYETLFPLLIARWRQAWHRPDLPFYFVQLPNLLKTRPQPTQSRWAELREAQFQTLRKLRHTGMAVTVDIGRGNNLHPRNKREVARRLWRWAAVRHYGRKVAASGPLFRSTEKRGRRMRITFSHVGSGLVAKGGSELTGFAVAGADRKFHWARARIVGDRVEVWSAAVPSPAAVRYAWADNPVGNLSNRVGLPASPFRSDAWPGLTAGKR